MRPGQLTQDRYYRGVPMAGYDLIKELVLVTVGVGVVTLVLALGLSSPDTGSVTIQSWSNADPVDFVTTAASELQGTSFSAQYGPPYNDNSDSVQAIGPLSPQAFAGNALHLDTATEFVLGPLTIVSATNADLATAVAQYNGATTDQQQTWLTNYATALANATANSDGSVGVASGDYGPAAALMNAELKVAQAGSLDGLLLSSPASFFQTDYTDPLLFMGDGTYLTSLAEPLHLTGDRWGVMNETGNYPGQTWLWLYSLPYHIAPYNTASNADLLVVMTVGVLTLLLALVPFIPILRDIPRWIPVHRLIWRHNGHEAGGGATPA
jgi:hypothetical protein